MSEPSTPPPGWYPDGSGSQRWGDGHQWGPPARSAAVPGVLPAAAIPVPPWGTWTWGDGRPIALATLPPYESSKKLVCGLLALFVPGLGIHKFVLGMTKEGLYNILLTMACGIGIFTSIIEGIIYLTKSDAEFYWTYVVGKKAWF